MKLIHIIHVQKYNLRHMPEQLHYDGTVVQLAARLVGFNEKDDFDSIQDLLIHLRKTDSGKDYNLVYSHEVE